MKYFTFSSIPGLHERSDPSVMNPIGTVCTYTVLTE